MLLAGFEIPDDEFHFEFIRSPGAGGQNVNKVNSKVRLHWSVLTSTGIPEAVRQRFVQRWASRLTSEGMVVISSSSYRDQPRNKQDTLERLAEMLEAVRRPPKLRKATKPSRAAKERRLGEKKRRSTVKKLRRSFDRE